MAKKNDRSKNTDAGNIEAIGRNGKIPVGYWLHNRDWTTKAFKIDRMALNKDISILEKELQFNGVYFLVGVDKNTYKTLMYVGQAKISDTNNDSLIRRLRQHHESRTEKYRDKWDTVIAVTSINGDWGPTEISALENIFYNLVPKENNLNGILPNSAGCVDNSYKDKVEHIKYYVSSFGISLFDSHNKDIETRAIDYSVESLETDKPVENLNIASRVPEITTPKIKVVQPMIESLPDEVWNKDTIFIDPVCKSGRYLEAIYDKLYNHERMIAEFPKDKDRILHIMNNQLFGIALSSFSYNTIKTALSDFDNNIRVINGYVKDVKDKLENGSIKEYADSIIKELGIDKREREGNVKFRVVIGNPPYQEKDDSGNDGGSALYDKFMQFSSHLAGENGIVSFVIPMRWMVQYRVKGVDKDWVRSELECNKYRSLYYTDESKDLFNGVNIRGGIMYFIKQNGYNGKCSIINLRDKDDIQERYLKTPGVDIFIPNKIMESIVEKVKSKDTFDSIVGPTNEFGIESNTVCTGKGIKVYRSFGNMDECSRDFITKGIDKIDLYKVLIGRTFGKGVLGERLPETRLIGPGEVCTGSLLAVGKSKDRDYCLNVQKYMQTKFMSILVSVMKSTHNATREAYQLVPLQDFTNSSDIDWTKSISDIDKQLYKKYNFSDEEATYVEKTFE